MIFQWICGSFGVVLFEFLIGQCPFSSRNTNMERDDATRRWKISYPELIGNGSEKDKKYKKISFPEDARDLLSNILRRNLQRRLTLPRIKRHEFFRDLNWIKLYQGELASTLYSTKRGNLCWKGALHGF